MAQVHFDQMPQGLPNRICAVDYAPFERLDVVTRIVVLRTIQYAIIEARIKLPIGSYIAKRRETGIRASEPEWRRKIIYDRVEDVLDHFDLKERAALKSDITKTLCIERPVEVS